MDRYREYDDDDRGYREPRSSSNKSTLVVLGIGALILGVCLVVCGGLVYFAAKAFQDGVASFNTSMQQAMQQAQQMQQDVQLAQSAADAFMQDIADGKHDAAYARTTKDFQLRQTRIEFRAFVDQNPALKNYQDDSLDGPNFTAPLSATIEGTLPGPNGEIAFTLMLIKEGQAWKVDRFTIP
jgi:hypothetical protein